MSITNGSELYTAVSNWLSRTDLASRVSEFITLFEAHANRHLRVRQMETQTSLELNTVGFATVPTDYLSWRAVEYVSGDRTVNLEYANIPSITELYPTSPAATPALFNISGESLQVMPAATSCVTFRYYQKLSAITTSTGSTNWLLTAHPDAYLFGSLAEAQGLIQEPMKVMGWIARRDAALNEITLLHQKTKAPAVMRVHGVYTP